MSEQSLFKKLLKRRVPQILGSYLVAGTSLILFIEYLVDKYQFPSHYPTLSLFALIGILPSVVIITYFHGAPGKDEWTKIEKIGIPINVLFIGGILFFGDSLNIWGIEEINKYQNPEKILIHITSLKEQIGKYEGNYYEFIKGNKLTSLKLDKLNLIRENIESMLLGEFIDTPYEIIISHSSNQLKFLDENHILDFSETSFLNVSINYKRFNKPTKIHFINIYEIQEEQKNKTPKYFYREMSWRNMPDTGNNWSKVDTTSGLINIEEVIVNNFKEIYSNSGEVAVVQSVEDGLIYIKLTNLKIKNNMVLFGVPFYDYKKNGRGLRVEDLNNAINYFSNSSDSVSQAKVNNYKKELKSIEKGTGFNWYGNNTRRFPAPIDFDYRLKVIDILLDSVAVAEVTKLDFPFVIIRDGDLLEID